MEIWMVLLIIVGAFIILYLGILLGKKLGKLQAERGMPDLIKEARDDAVKRSRSVLGGQFSEQLAPYFPDFPYSPNEIRFIGKPIDFIVFKGMDNKDISEVVFVEVKSGKSQLSTQERKLRDVVRNKKVSWEQYNVSNSKKETFK